MAARLDPVELAARATNAVQPRFPGASVSNVEQLIGGTSSLTYAADMTVGGATSRIVIKAAPPGLEPVRNRDVLRQARLLDLLASVPAVKVPHVLGSDLGAPVDVPPLFVMTFVPGVSYEPRTAAEEADTPYAEIEARAFTAARMAAALHAVPTDHPGLAGERVTDLEMEVGRWTRAFGSVEDDLRVGTQDVNDRLLAAMPKAIAPSVLHGDWRLGNMQCNGPSVDAVIDWEIWSIGDRRVDLAWMLLMVDEKHPNKARDGAGLPSVPALIAAYEEAAGLELEQMSWFAALVRYKQAAASALIIKNNRKVLQPGIDIDRMVTQMPNLLNSARDLLA